MQLKTALRWGLPVLATATLLVAIRTQILWLLPLVIVALVLWLGVLPRPLYRG